jgi:hypothetical protein
MKAQEKQRGLALIEPMDWELQPPRESEKIQRE